MKPACRGCSGEGNDQNRRQRSGIRIFLLYSFFSSCFYLLCLILVLFPSQAAEETPEAEGKPETSDAATQTPPTPTRVLMVQVENVTHDKFQTTEEVKASGSNEKNMKK